MERIEYNVWSDDGKNRKDIKAMSQVIDAIREGVPAKVQAALANAEEVIGINPLELLRADGQTLMQFAKQVEKESGQTVQLDTAKLVNDAPDHGKVSHDLQMAEGKMGGFAARMSGRTDVKPGGIER